MNDEVVGTSVFALIMAHKAADFAMSVELSQQLLTENVELAERCYRQQRIIDMFVDGHALINEARGLATGQWEVTRRHQGLA